MSPTKGPISREIYTQRVLHYLYDWVVLGSNMKYLWRCPTRSVLLPFFQENFSANHLDCGVASGYFPAACLRSSSSINNNNNLNQKGVQRLALLDFNPNCLRTTERIIRSQQASSGSRRKVELQCVEADVTAPLPQALLQDARMFSSISMFNVLHCSFRNLARVLDPHEGVLTGCTVLGEPYATWRLGRLGLRHMNRVGVFHSLGDNREEIEKALDEAFEEVQTWLVGMVLLFKARKPRKLLGKDVLSEE
ncbi:hypothetical protein PG991_009595 [Apiospora marii]|uniref:Methyltransferase type 11 domain-containing protein n=1 Tax=Apiospora marii TaxID=335849 RepID=A0ABR1RLC5_9PEZI